MLKILSCPLLVLSLAVFCLAQTAPPQTARGYFETGLNLLREKRFAEALDAFRNSARLDPKQPATQANIGAALLGLGKAGEAVAAYREAIRMAPGVGVFHSSICEALMVTKNYSEAVAECSEGVRLDPDSSEANAVLIHAKRLAKSPQADLQRSVDLALAKFPDSEVVIAAAAEFYSSIRSAYAVELYEKLTRLKPDTSVYHAHLAEDYMRIGRDVEAVAEARRALELEPLNPYANYFMGKLFFELGLHEDAAAAFEKVVASGETFRDARIFLGRSQSVLGRLASAIATLRAGVAEYPDDFSYRFEFGEKLIKDSKYEDAVTPLRAALGLNPESIEAKTALGLALFESAQYDQAIPILEEADRKKPRDPVITMFLSVAQARQENLPRIEEMKNFAKENPTDVKVRGALIQSLAFTRRISEAAPYLKQLLELKPTNIHIYMDAAVGYSTSGNLDTALEICRKSLEVKESPDAYLILAGIYQRRGQADEASKAYEKVIELKPEVPNIMKLYGDHLWNNGKRREALEMYKRSLAIQPTNPPVLFSAAVLSAKLGDLESARSYLEVLRSADPILSKRLERCLRLKLL